MSQKSPFSNITTISSQDFSYTLCSPKSKFPRHLAIKNVSPKSKSSRPLAIKRDCNSNGLNSSSKKIVTPRHTIKTLTLKREKYNRL